MPELTLGDLLAALRRRWLLVLLIAVPIAVTSARYAESLPDEYESFAVFSLTLRPDADVSSDLIRLEVQRYAVSLASPAALRRVADDLAVDRELVDDSVAITTPPDTGNIRIGVTGEDPGTSARIANRLAALAQEQVVDDPLLRGVLAAEAVPPTETVGPARQMVVAAGVVLGVLAGVAALLLLERLDPEVHDVGTLARRAEPVRILGAAALGGSSGRRSPTAGRRVDSVVRRVKVALVRERIPAPQVLAVLDCRTGSGAAVLAAALHESLPRPDRPAFLLDVPARDGPRAVHHLPRAWRRLATEDGDTAPGDSLVLSPGREAPPPETVLALLQRARARGGSVVVDGGTVTDDLAPVLVAGADAVLLVVDRGCPVPVLTEALEVVWALKVRVLGLVLNTSPRSRVLRRYVENKELHESWDNEPLPEPSR